MKYLVLAFASLIILAGCDQNPSSTSASYQAKGGNQGEAAAFGKVTSESNNAKLSYTHDLELEMHPENIKPRYDRARDFCLKNVQLNCILVNSSLRMGDAQNENPPNAHLTVRLPHDGVSQFEENLESALPGEAAGDTLLLSHSTSVDDLTKSIEDVERREQQLTDYRDRLTTLSKRSDAKVDDLVKIESELSNVQSQIEAITAQKKGLNERVATEVLSVFLASERDLGGSFAPVKKAWKHAGHVLGESSGKALSFAIASLPWLPIFALGLLFIRFVIRRWRR